MTRSSGGRRTSRGTARSRRSGGWRRPSGGPGACSGRPWARTGLRNSRWRRTSCTASARGCWCSRTEVPVLVPGPRLPRHRGAHPVARLGVLHAEAGESPARRHVPGGTEAAPQERRPGPDGAGHRVHRAHRRGNGTGESSEVFCLVTSLLDTRSTRRWTWRAATRTGGVRDRHRPPQDGDGPGPARPALRRTPRACSRKRGRCSPSTRPSARSRHRGERDGHSPGTHQLPARPGAATVTVAAFPPTSSISPRDVPAEDPHARLLRPRPPRPGQPPEDQEGRDFPARKPGEPSVTNVTRESSSTCSTPGRSPKSKAIAQSAEQVSRSRRVRRPCAVRR